MKMHQNPGNLIQLLASYRRVEFPQGAPAARRARIAETVDNNCAVTIRFAENMLRKVQIDGELLFSLCSLRSEAIALRRACRSLIGSSRPLPGAKYRLVTLRSQYDIFMSSVRHFFFLLDHDLAGRIDGAL
ncbi:MAG TPA: hypothetical protein VKW06_11085 [Candidatus Angelobacter sp.]|nr:hypothetical protein [Candidatus Angelobacter sp.]